MSGKNIDSVLLGLAENPILSYQGEINKKVFGIRKLWIKAEVGEICNVERNTIGDIMQPFENPVLIS